MPFRHLVFYGAVMILLGSSIALILKIGATIAPSETLNQTIESASALPSQATARPPDSLSLETITKIASRNLSHPTPILLLQMIVIVSLAWLVGTLFKMMGQPSVMGEIVAGIILGPSLIGSMFPHLTQALFPPASMGILQMFSQMGVILFMFIIGMELDVKLLRKTAESAVIVSHASIIIPFALGMALALAFFNQHAPAGVSFSAFSLFMGIAMSITAFPVLARVIKERNLSGTNLGTTAITCAAVDDVTAWSILALIISIVEAESFASTVYTISFSVIFVLVMITAVKPLLNKLVEKDVRDGTLEKSTLGLLLVLVAGALATECIGIHAIFGAFMAGIIMPDSPKFREHLTRSLDMSAYFMIPLFFAFTGLRTHIGLLNDAGSWITFAAIMGVAILGKFGGSAVAAKFTGMNWPDSLAIGALMNTRGLVELIVLNIGFDLGILSAKIFTMLVLMALLTTLMTGPALTLISHFAAPALRPKNQNS